MRSRFLLATIVVLAAAAVIVSNTGTSAGQTERGQPLLGEAQPAGQPSETDDASITIRYRPGVPAVAGLVQGSTLGVRTRVYGNAGIQIVKLRPGTDIDAALATVQASPLVAEANLSRTAQAFDAPNDTNYAYQWHMHNTAGGVHAEDAWALAPNRGEDVTVAVIDTGVAYEEHDGSLLDVFPQHFERSPDLVNTEFVAPWDYVNIDSHANDDNGHGTHVTGTIVQTTNNAYGVTGMADQATIMPIKVLDYSGFGQDGALVDAIYYAVDHGADVINMSLGFTGTGTPDGNGVYCTEIVGLNAALVYAEANNVVIVAAAGNDNGGPVACPAAHPSVISVAASRFDGQIASYSNRGETLDVTAPGGDPNADQNGDGFSDGVVQDTYCYDWLSLFFLGTYDEFCNIFMSGTSMATPHVAGLAALLLGEDSALTPGQVRAHIETTARDRGDAGWDAVYGWGVIDAGAALASLTGATPPAPTATDTPVPPTATNTPVPPTATNTPVPPTATNTPAVGPDLVESFLANPPASVRRGGRFTASDATLNQGTSRAERTTTRFYLSLDQQRNGGDVLLSGSRSVGRLNPGTTSSGNTRLTVPSGTALQFYYLIACADDTSRVVESNESNNCRVSATRVQIIS